MAPVDDDRTHLFETHDGTERSRTRYLKLIVPVAFGVAVAAAAALYLTQPGVGDHVKAPAGLEDAVRSHFLETEKRTATDVTTYLCGDHYWTRVGVETRPDIPGKPFNTVAVFRARVTGQPDGTWAITAAPVLEKTDDVPCSF